MTCLLCGHDKPVAVRDAWSGAFICVDCRTAMQAPGGTGGPEHIAARLREAQDLVYVPPEEDACALTAEQAGRVHRALFNAGWHFRALAVLAAFARTAPGRLPAEVQAALDLVPWDSEKVRALTAERSE